MFVFLTSIIIQLAWFLRTGPWCKTFQSKFPLLLDCLHLFPSPFVLLIHTLTHGHQKEGSVDSTISRSPDCSQLRVLFRFFFLFLGCLFVSFCVSPGDAKSKRRRSGGGEGAGTRLCSQRKQKLQRARPRTPLYRAVVCCAVVLDGLIGLKNHLILIFIYFFCTVVRRCSSGQVIEGRELKGRDGGGTSDPICFVTVHGQKQKTIVVKKTLNVTWVRGFAWPRWQPHSC